MQQDNSSFWTDIKAFEEQLAKSPNSFCFARLSEVYLKVGLVDDALHTARQGVVKHPGYLGGQRALAMACHAKGLNDECLSLLRLVTVAMPEDQQAQRLLGRLLADTGDKDSARQAFQTVLEFAPDDVESRIGLEALEFSGGSAPSSHFVNIDEEEEIIEDLEMLEELEVYEEDEPDTDLAEQEPPLMAEPVAELHHDPLSTGTLAELYIKQGFIHKALEIYRSILAEDPGNSAISHRIAVLELQDKPAEVPEPSAFEELEPPACEETFEYESEEAAVLDYDEDTQLLGNVFGAIPESAALPVSSVQEEKLFVPPIESVNTVVNTRGTADNALSTLEGWLENIRRVKSCR